MKPLALSQKARAVNLDRAFNLDEVTALLCFSLLHSGTN
uniref:Uncharacterized protein n=1 Tax=Rhizophora mucronata TaxID=61149 RepID=A0A2P2NS88_RHIMU